MPTMAGAKAARQAVRREIARTGSDAAALARAAGVHAQTVQAFLNGSRWPALKTLGRLDVALGWPAGTLSAVGEEDASAPSADEPQGAPDSDLVSDDAYSGDSILYLRPPGLTDEAWEQVQAESRSVIEWAIDRAVRERRPNTRSD